MNKTSEVEPVSDPNEDRYGDIAVVFESGQYAEASSQYYAIKEDTTISATLRSKSCFSHAWLNDHYLFDMAAAVDSYNYMVTHFPEDPLTKSARNRLNALTDDPAPQKDLQKEEEPEDKLEEKYEDRDQPENLKSKRPNDSKEGEDQK
jgi:hypothetical protein